MQQDIIKGLEIAFIDKESHEDARYTPQFISNDGFVGKKVITTIINELNNCDEFLISVAFITNSGFTLLIETLNTLEKKGIKGKILTTDYLNFSEPKALKRLNEYKNIEIKMYRTEDFNHGFHTKGYMFKKGDIYTFIVGSSNLTMNAMTINREWNSKLIASSKGEYTKLILEEFTDIWHSSSPIHDILSDYEVNYIKDKEIRKKESKSIFAKQIIPNSMQVDFIDKLVKTMEYDNKGLLVSATGTGKTFAAAFGVQKVNPKRILFLVHREQIAKQAISTFRRIFGNSKTYGLISGNEQNFDNDYLFSTMQMMSKEHIYSRFSKDEFDFIIIDESHRIGANSYQKIIKYFKPNFLLGMSASPERSDDFDVYKTFNNNIIKEIRLKEALKNDLLCPFHYFGISDLQINDENIDDKTEFSKLVSTDRVKHIVEKIELYGYSGDKVKGLMFCRNILEAQELSKQLNIYGYQTLALSGSDTQSYREEAIERLVDENRSDYLDYILTIDIFNEGVDIPEINQVIMLRPTKSPIIFVQQLGRGLRKYQDKEFVTILDFIGNYDNNFMIPIALSGDRSYNKDNIRMYVAEGSRVIPGASSINFDEISKQRIFKSIDNAKFNSTTLIVEAYNQFRNKLGKIPRMIDFIKYEELDLGRVFDNKALKTYHNLLLKTEKDYNVVFNPIQTNILEFISTKIANGKRVHEIILLDLLLKNNSNIKETWIKILEDEYYIIVNDNTIINVENIMTNNFITGTGKSTFDKSILIDIKNNEWTISEEFNLQLSDYNFRKMLEEIIEYTLYLYNIRYNKHYTDTNFVLYEKYTYEDVCRLLEWEKAEVALNIGGYKYDKKTKTYPVFINYDKHEDISATIAYEDEFISNRKLIAISKSGRTLNSEDVRVVMNAKELNVNMHLFVRKNKDDKTSKEFYYLGKINILETPEEFMMKNTNKSAVRLIYGLHTPVKEDLYDYIVEVKDI